MKSIFVSLVAGCVLAGAVAAPAQQNPPGAGPAPAVWFRDHVSHANDQAVQKTLDLMKRAKAAGYNGFVIEDNFFARWNELTPQHLENMKKVRQACRELGLEYIVSCLPMGYANDILTNDPNLVEGLPVKEAPFVVKNGQLVPVADVELINGDFTRHENNKPLGWDMDDIGTACFVDTTVTYNGKPSIRMEDPKTRSEHGRTRAWQQLKVKPWRYYHFSVAIKTENYTGRDVRLMALGVSGEHEGRHLNIPYAYAKQNQDWTRLHYVFNTQDCENVTIYIGDWGAGTGKLWFADVTLAPAGLVNIIRRPGASFTATLADGTTVLEEGKDLPPMVDPLLGRSPALGRYHWHDAPTLTIPAGSRLKEGDTVLLSYYHTMVMCYGDQMVICMADPKTNELIAWNIRQIKQHLDPDVYFMMHDEIRTHGWDQTCVQTGKTPGQILADNMRFCAATIRQEDPGKRMFVWSDMFDMYHNANVDDYYAVVRGRNPWFGSWEGLPQDVGLFNWNGASADSLKWFASRGHQQIITADTAADIAARLDNAKGLSGILGGCYVTWSGDFGQLEAFADAIRKHFAQQPGQ